MQLTKIHYIIIVPIFNSNLKVDMLQNVCCWAICLQSALNAIIEESQRILREKEKVLVRVFYMNVCMYIHADISHLCDSVRDWLVREKGEKRPWLSFKLWSGDVW